MKSVPWRGHSCLPRRDSSRRSLLSAAGNVQKGCAADTSVRATSTAALARLLLLALAATPAWGQFQLYLVNGANLQPVVHAYDFGAVAIGTPAAAAFQITNTSSTSATLNLLTVTGSGFSVASGSAPLLPVSLASQKSVHFTVVFQATVPGTYSAALNSVGIAVTLTATVPGVLTYQWVTATGVQLLSAGPVSFGPVPVGQSPTIEILLLNQTSVALTAPAVSVSGTGFSLSGQPPAGTVKPAASMAFEIQFSPTAAGVSTGTLTIGGQSFALTGTGVIPPLPQPQIVLTAQPESDRQGTVAITWSAPSQTSATGTVALSFLPLSSIPSATDPAIAFASGGQSTIFNVFIGATQAVFGSTANTMPFQTGTTAGTLTVTVELGGITVQQSITILPAIVDVTVAQGIRSTGTLEVDLTGFDNTRSAGALSFTFFDASGNPIAPAVPSNGSSAFAAYFKNSAGGTFELKAVFPVVGDISTIASFQAVVTNSAGNATTARTNF